ncbi:MAG: hypothetical protein PHQ46_06820 [Negativicutes bacterium]|nr:hypothetical protein [Negativicutes bacterium]
MDITVRIDAPELVSAINTLATALEVGNFKLTQANIVSPAPVAQPAIAPAAPQAIIPQTVTPPAAPAPVVTVAQPVAQQPVQPASAVPTAAPSYSMEQLAVAATQLVDAGRRADLVNLLHTFQVEALTGLPKVHYGDFANALRQMGAKL